MEREISREGGRKEGTDGGEGEVSANKGEEKQQMGEGGDKWGQTTTHAMRWGSKQGRRSYTQKKQMYAHDHTHPHTDFAIKLAN